MGIEGTWFNILKAIYHKPTANIILNGEKVEVFSLRSQIRQECPLPPLLFNISIEGLSHNNQTRKRNKSYPNWKGIKTGKQVTVLP